MEHQTKTEEEVLDDLQIKKEREFNGLQEARFHKDRIHPVDIYEVEVSKEDLYGSIENSYSEKLKSEKQKAQNEATKKKQQEVAEKAKQKVNDLMQFEKDAKMDQLEHMLIESKNKCNHLENEVM